MSCQDQYEDIYRKLLNKSAHLNMSIEWRDRESPSNKEIADDAEALAKMLESFAKDCEKYAERLWKLKETISSENA